MNAPLWVAVPVIAMTAWATRADVRTRRIPNYLTGPALLMGVAAHWVMHGAADAVQVAAAALLAGALFFPGWMLGWMGAGDVKLMAAVGAWLGFPSSVYALLASLVAGGVIAVIVAWHRGILVRSIVRAARLASGSAGRPEGEAEQVVRFPFALAILAGTVFALWWPS